MACLRLCRGCPAAKTVNRVVAAVVLATDKLRRMTSAARNAARPGRRLRCAVRPADRPPGPRGARLQRDRAVHDAGREMLAKRPGGAHPLRRAVLGLRGGRPAGRPARSSRPACPHSASATASRRWRWRWAARSRRPGCREFGRTPLRVAGRTSRAPRAGSRRSCRSGCRHGDSVSAAPEGFVVTATSAGAAVAAFEDVEPAAGGGAVPPRGAPHRARPAGPRALPLRRRRARARPGPRPPSSTSRSSRIRAQVGGKRVICGLSGGVDSAVAAALVQRAVGDQLTCVFVDHGLLRRARPSRSSATSSPRPASRSRSSTATDTFLAALAGVTDPEQKRKTIGREFIRVFEAGRARGRRRRRRAR